MIKIKCEEGLKPELNKKNKKKKQNLAVYIVIKKTDVDHIFSLNELIKKENGSWLF